MEENCMVLSGDWVCSDVGTWDFVIEKNRMGRMVEIYDGIGCKELAGNVLREFKLDEERYGVTLSYWPPTSFELATGIRTPPVMITNHGAVKYFCDHQKVKGGMNLFAKFELKTDSVDTEVVDDSGMAFVSPEAARFVEKRDFGSASSKKGYVSSAASKNRVIHRGSDTRFDFVSEKAASLGGMGDLGSGSSKKRNVTSPYKKSRVIDISDEDELVREVEKLEETIMSEGGKGGTSLGEDESEIVEGLTKKKGPRTYFCDTKSCFDHYVEVGGGSGGEDKAKEEMPEVANPWSGGGGVNRNNEPKRRLADIDDEEFDIPPLFDDTEFDAAEIPDMDVDEHDGKIEVGKCPDSRCDWRVTAHEVRGCGYYEIRKAQLDHSCPIEFRNGYKSKATSRVIAAVYKAKFGDSGKLPVARDLQKLVLEDLRVDASYMKCYRAKEKGVLGLRGSDEDSYLKLPEYLYMLKLANPGTIADLETDVDDDGDERFLGQDANFQIFPLAFAVVDSEDEDAWTWFLQKVERILCDSPSLAIISDRAVSISNAVSKIYPQAKHGACIVHLARNVNSRFSSKNLAKMVTAAAMAHSVGEFRDYYGKIRAANSECGIYLGQIGVARWSRANFPADGVGVPYDTLCGHWYKTTVWRETYAGVINPHGAARDVDIPEEVSSQVVYPPNTKRQPGRRRKTRIPSTGEIRVRC
ncbi:hypothetical protein BRARA_K00569 [Brassica rapa]|uniref:MULE transposase domain-containing protein n=1 Tax=Brassica campestris TaxID=3711 RepID=A0A397KXM2_BRACM|nr:hypothetical protein BRARA_K00569 [Brassica rapa]